MKHVYSIKYMSQMYHLEFGVAFTMFFIAPLTLSRHNKLTVSKTLPSSFAIKSTWLKSTLVICLSICRIERKKCNLDVYGSKIRSQDQFPKKKSNLNSSNLEKRYQITILCLLSIFQTWDLKKSLVKIPGDQYRFEKSKKARKPEISTFWIEKCPKCLCCPGTQTSQNLVGKMCKNKL